MSNALMKWVLIYYANINEANDIKRQKITEKTDRTEKEYDENPSKKTKDWSIPTLKQGEKSAAPKGGEDQHGHNQ